MKRHYNETIERSLGQHCKIIFKEHGMVSVLYDGRPLIELVNQRFIDYLSTNNNSNSVLQLAVYRELTAGGD